MNANNQPLPKPVMFILFFILGSLYFLSSPPVIDTANLTNASVTMSNSRFSYRADIGATSAVGSSYVIVNNTSTVSVGNTSNSHLFPNDTLCFWDSASTSCVDSTTYTINSTGTGNTDFNINKPLGSRLTGGTYALVNQATYLTISFTLATSVPSNGDIQISIPAANQTAALNRDGMANTGTGVTGAGNNGWDIASLNSSGTAVTMAATDVYVTTGTGWSTNSITAGTSGGAHIIVINASATAASGTTITINVGSTSSSSGARLTNPAPISTSHVNGVADIYTITAKTRDGSDATIDTVDMKVAPVDGVLVSATVDETLAFTVAGITGTTACGQTVDVTATATSVPWGTLSASDQFSEAAQRLTVSTNADAGYSVRIDENDQMGKDGVACVGDVGEAVNCIEDTDCDGTCTESTSAEWTTATNNGLGFSIQNIDGTDGAFTYSESGRTFSAKQLPDLEAGNTAAVVMTNSSQVSSNDIFVCYRISVSATQPAGYYFNKVKYTATAIF